MKRCTIIVRSVVIHALYERFMQVSNTRKRFISELYTVEIYKLVSKT